MAASETDLVVSCETNLADTLAVLAMRIGTSMSITNSLAFGRIAYRTAVIRVGDGGASAC